MRRRGEAQTDMHGHKTPPYHQIPHITSPNSFASLSCEPLGKNANSAL